MTAQEIKAILEERMSIEDFAFGDFGPDESFVGSPEVEEIKAKKEAARQALINHPIHNGPWNERQTNPEYNELREAYDSLPSEFNARRNEWLESLGLGPIEEVASKGGEGEGEEWYVVYHFPKHNIYLKCDGFYQSYNGTEFYDGWDDCFEVKPKEITVTVYEKL
jgi:hypothetical protein